VKSAVQINWTWRALAALCYDPCEGVGHPEQLIWVCVVIGIMSQALYKYGVVACFLFPGSRGRHSPRSIRQKVNRQTKGWLLFPRWPLRPQICCSRVCVNLVWTAPSGQHPYPPLCAQPFHRLMQLFFSVLGSCSHTGWSNVRVWHGEKWTGWVWRPQTPSTHPGYLWRAAHPHPVQSTGKVFTWSNSKERHHVTLCDVNDYVNVLRFIFTLMSLWRSLRCRLLDTVFCGWASWKSLLMIIAFKCISDVCSVCVCVIDV